MLLLTWNNKPRTFRDFDHMMAALKLTEIDVGARAAITRASSRGDSLFGCGNPYVSEMGAGENPPAMSLMVDASASDLASRFWTLRDEI